MRKRKAGTGPGGPARPNAAPWRKLRLGFASARRPSAGPQPGVGPAPISLAFGCEGGSDGKRRVFPGHVWEAELADIADLANPGGN